MKKTLALLSLSGALLLSGCASPAAENAPIDPGTTPATVSVPTSSEPAAPVSPATPDRPVAPAPLATAGAVSPQNPTLGVQAGIQLAPAMIAEGQQILLLDMENGKDGSVALGEEVKGMIAAEPVNCIGLAALSRDPQGILKIQGFLAKDEVEAKLKFEGLGDQNSAEFSSAEQYFTLSISPVQLQSLGQLQAGQLLSVVIEKGAQAGANNRLKEFTVEK